MRRHRSLRTDDWDKLGERLLAAAAEALRDSIAKRSGAPANAFTTQVRDGRSACVETNDVNLISMEIGASGRPPSPFICPQREDLDQLRDSLHAALRKERL